MRFDRGILSFSHKCRGRVGAFTASKKPKEVDGVVVQRKRLVLDCGQTNLLFRPSPHTQLGLSPAFGNCSFLMGMFISGAVMQDCFYAVHSSTWEDVLSMSQGRFRCDPEEIFSPCTNVLPMGFSWSFFWFSIFIKPLWFEVWEFRKKTWFLMGVLPLLFLRERFWACHIVTIISIALDHWIRSGKGWAW